MENPLKKIRQALEINAGDMARLMGVSIDTYYRREADPMSTLVTELHGLKRIGVNPLVFFYPHLYPFSCDVTTARCSARDFAAEAWEGVAR